MIYIGSEWKSISDYWISNASKRKSTRSERKSISANWISNDVRTIFITVDCYTIHHISMFSLLFWYSSTFMKQKMYISQLFKHNHSMKKLSKTTVIFLVHSLSSVFQTCVILVTANATIKTKQEALRLLVTLTSKTLILILTLIS